MKGIPTHTPWLDHRAVPSMLHLAAINRPSSQNTSNRFRNITSSLTNYTSTNTNTNTNSHNKHCRHSSIVSHTARTILISHPTHTHRSNCTSRME